MRTPSAPRPRRRRPRRRRHRRRPRRRRRRRCRRRRHRSRRRFGARSPRRRRNGRRRRRRRCRRRYRRPRPSPPPLAPPPTPPSLPSAAPPSRRWRRRRPRRRRRRRRRRPRRRALGDGAATAARRRRHRLAAAAVFASVDAARYRRSCRRAGLAPLPSPSPPPPPLPSSYRRRRRRARWILRWCFPRTRWCRRCSRWWPTCATSRCPRCTRSTAASPPPRWSTCPHELLSCGCRAPLLHPRVSSSRRCLRLHQRGVRIRPRRNARPPPPPCARSKTSAAAAARAAAAAARAAARHPARLPRQPLALCRRAPGHGDPPWLVEFVVAIPPHAARFACFGVCCLFYRRRRERKRRPLPPRLYAAVPPPLPYLHARPSAPRPICAPWDCGDRRQPTRGGSAAAALAEATRAAPPGYPFRRPLRVARPAPPPAITHAASPTGSMAATRVACGAPRR